MNVLVEIATGVLMTLRDIAPIAAVLIAFQAATVRRLPANFRSIMIGLLHLVIGLTLFRVGLDISIVPIGKEMAAQLSGPVLNRGDGLFRGILPLCLFAALLGFTATLIEPSLIAIADRVRNLSGGALNAWRLRVLVAIGVASGLLIGTLRVLFGIPLELLVLGLILLIAPLALTGPRQIVPVALDSGGVATSVVVVPLIAAFGIAVAETLPGRDPVRDGFGLIVLALLMPALTILAYAKAAQVRQQRHERKERKKQCSSNSSSRWWTTSGSMPSSRRQETQARLEPPSSQADGEKD